MDKKILFGKDYLDKATQYAESNKTLMFMVLTTLAIIALLIKALMSQETEVIIEFPKELIIERDEPIKVGNNFGNEGFWRLWGVGTVESEWTKIDPKNIDASIDYMLNMMTQKTYINKFEELEAIRETVKKNSVSVEYRRRGNLISITNNGLSAVVKIDGIGSMKIGADPYGTKECVYEFAFKKEKGAVYVEDFNTDCFNLDGYKLGSSAGNTNR